MENSTAGPALEAVPNETSASAIEIPDEGGAVAASSSTPPAEAPPAAEAKKKATPTKYVVFAAILAEPLPEDASRDLPTVSELPFTPVGTFAGQGQEEAKRAFMDTASDRVRQAADRGVLALATVPVSSWKPRAVKPLPPARPRYGV